MASVGDKIWYAKCDWLPVKVTCPVCFGKLKVTLILGDDTHVETPCDYCGKGYEGPKGYVEEYQYVNDPELRTIDKIEAEVTSCGTKFKYISLISGSFDNCCSCIPMDPENMFENKDDAEKRCAILKAQLEESQATRIRDIKKYAHKNYSWNAGYHITQAKRLRADADRHDRYAVICKDRARV